MLSSACRSKNTKCVILILDKFTYEELFWNKNFLCQNFHHLNEKPIDNPGMDEDRLRDKQVNY